MSKYGINPDEIGHEAKPMREYKPGPNIKNQLCPRDGHYCEQPNCENCMFEESQS